MQEAALTSGSTRPPEVGQLFAGFAVQAVETTWTIGEKPRRAGEVLIGAASP